MGVINDWRRDALLLCYGASLLQVCPSLHHRMPGVITWIVFVIRAVVGDALNDDFGIVAAGEGALRVGPIVLGLAFMFGGHRSSPFLGLAKVAGCFGRVFVDREVAERIDGIAFLARLDNELLGKFVVGESRQAQHARRVGCRQITAKFICETVKERFRLILTESAHFPHDLALAGRGVEDEVWRWHFG